MATKEAHLRAVQRWLAKPGNREARNAARRLKRTGVSKEMFNVLMALQGGRCAICGVLLTKHIHADHCHDTGKPRGLLCHNCNMAEGQLKKIGLTPEEFIKRLRQYLDDPPARIAELV